MLWDAIVLLFFFGRRHRRRYRRPSGYVQAATFPRHSLTARMYQRTTCIETNMKEGPRQSKRNQQYLHQAEAELNAEKKAREESEEKAIAAARFDAAGRGVVATSVPASRPSCLDVGPDFGSSSNETSENSGYWHEANSFAKDEALCNGKAITFWSTGANRANFPAKSCGFTNPLEDGRLHHDEGTDFAVSLE